VYVSGQTTAILQKVHISSVLSILRSDDTGQSALSSRASVKVSICQHVNTDIHCTQIWMWTTATR
jgi:hypothetical protein